MKELRALSQKPLGQVLLATLLFCFIFLALFVGLYKSGIAYIGKEHARRSTNLTALTAGSVYANGLQMVRETNLLLMVLVSVDLYKDGTAAALASEGGPPAMVAAALAADKVNSRTPFQKFQSVFFGIDASGVYPFLIAGQALATANENQLSLLPVPAYAYNYETATAEDVLIPNMALRFRTAAELLPEPQKKTYSLLHNGERQYFSSDEVESAHNPRHPNQMRVKKDSNSDFAGWWVRKEKNGSDTGKESGSLSGSLNFLNSLKDFLKQFKLDVTDRDDPPCHTFSLFSSMKSKLRDEERNFYQAGEIRVDSYGLAAWNILPFQIYMEKVDISSFPVIRDTFEKFNGFPAVDQVLKSSDIVNGL